jgi:hypothetical protein
MALVPCPECNKKISDSAAHCPQCGFVLSVDALTRVKKKETTAKRQGGWAGLLLLFLGGFCLWGIFSSSAKRDGSVQHAPPTYSSSLVNVPSLLGRSEPEVTAMLGPVESVHRERRSLSSDEMLTANTYQNGGVEVWFDRGVVSSIQYFFPKDQVPAFRKESLELVGLPVVQPHFANIHTMRWRDLAGCWEVSMFADGNKVDHLWIQVDNPDSLVCESSDGAMSTVNRLRLAPLPRRGICQLPCVTSH